jgi:hypothetical protein
MDNYDDPTDPGYRTEENQSILPEGIAGDLPDDYETAMEGYRVEYRPVTLPSPVGVIPTKTRSSSWGAGFY